MTVCAQQKPQTLTPGQMELLERVGACEGPELIRRLFYEVLSGRTYADWARGHGFSYPLVKAVIHRGRGNLGLGPKSARVRAALARDLGLPEAVLFKDDPRPDAAS